MLNYQRVSPPESLLHVIMSWNKWLSWPPENSSSSLLRAAAKPARRASVNRFCETKCTSWICSTCELRSYSHLGLMTSFLSTRSLNKWVIQAIYHLGTESHDGFGYHFLAASSKLAQHLGFPSKSIWYDEVCQ